MEIPKNTSLHETTTSTAWVDENGILCSVSKKAPAQTLDEAKRDLVAFRDKFGDKKYCMLLDITHSAPSTKEVRDWGADELSKLIKALAMVSNSALGKMVANLFFGLKPPPYPTKMFTDEKDAKEWLKQYL